MKDSPLIRFALNFFKPAKDTIGREQKKHGEHLRDVYAQFGLTFSHACNVEAVLANAILASDFVRRVITESQKAGKPIYNKNELGNRFEEFLAKRHREMMGNLVQGIKGLIKLDDALEKRVDDALRRRNYLTHNFWRERGGEALSRARRDIVVKELVADQAFFEQLAIELEAIVNSEIERTPGRCVLA